MKRILFTILSLILALSLLAGCDTLNKGNGSGDSSDKNNSTDSFTIEASSDICFLGDGEIMISVTKDSPKKFANKTLNIEIIGDDIAITMLENDTIIFPTHFKGTISVFAFTDTCTITEKGLLYELNDNILSHNYPLGISNEFTGKDAFISAKKGKACVMWEDLSEGYTIGGLL